MRKTIALIITFAVLISVFSVFSRAVQSAPSLSAACAVLTDASDGEILYSENEKIRAAPASLTKIMTAIVVIEECDTGSSVTTPPEAVGIEGSSAYLEAGEVFTVKDLLYMLLLQSANDAAISLAVFCAGSVDAFVLKMNRKAYALGLFDTHFSNPHGLPASNHYSTAYDLAILLAYCMKDPVFSEISATYQYVIKAAEGHRARVITNHNRLLVECDGVRGGKTGYTKASGRCLCTYCERNGVKLCAVTLNAPDDWRDHKLLYEYGYGLYENVTLEAYGVYTLHIVGGTASAVTASVADDVCIYTRYRPEQIEKKIYMRRFEYAPVKEGQYIGTVVWSFDGKDIAKIKLYADMTVNKKEHTGIF